MTNEEWLRSLISGQGNRSNRDPFRQSLLKQLGSSLDSETQSVWATNLPMDTLKEQTPSPSVSSQKKSSESSVEL